MWGVEISILIAVALIFLFAGAVKGVLGFGLPIITMSLLPFIMPVEVAIVISAIVQPATNVFQLVTAGDLRQSVRLSIPVVLMLVPGVALGGWYLTSLNSNTLLLMVGLTITAYALFDLMGYKISISEKYRMQSGLGFGFVAGIFGALTALNGWAFIIYLVGIGVDRRTFRSAIALLFLVSGVLISSSFWLIGWLDGQAAFLGVLAMLAAFPGMAIGNRLGARLPAALFRRLILIALVFVGLIITVQGWVT